MTHAATQPTGSVQPPLGWEVGVSVALHLVLVLALWGAQAWHDPPPLFKPQDVMMVQAVALPKQTSRLPDRASRTADPVAGQEPTAPAEVPPTASDMVLKDPKADPTKGTPTTSHTQDRERLLREMKREELLRDMTAPLGSEDRVQTDPNGVDPKDAILGSGSTTPMDPVLARYISQCKQKILPNWSPLPATLAAHPEYAVHIQVRVAADGTLSEPQVLQGTGDPSFDRSALLAIYKTATLPPPPEAYAASAAAGVIITLPARDLQ